jgi:hypothetical protein
MPPKNTPATETKVETKPVEQKPAEQPPAPEAAKPDEPPAGGAPAAPAPAPEPAPVAAAPAEPAKVVTNPKAPPRVTTTDVKDRSDGKVRAKVVSGKYAGIKPNSPDPFVYVTPEQLKNFRGVLAEATLSEADPQLRTAAQ